MRCVRVLVLGGMLFGFSGLARAAGEPVVIFDTFPFDGPPNKNRIVGCNSLVYPCAVPLQNPSQQWADWFQVSGGDYTLDRITIRFVSANGNILARVWDDAGGVPGALLEELPLIPGPFTSTLGVNKETQS